MEAEMVEAVIAGDAQDAFPGRDIGRRITVFGEDAAFERAAEEDRSLVQHDLLVHQRDIAQAKRGGMR
jgi:hypothetical protein